MRDSTDIFRKFVIGKEIWGYNINNEYQPCAGRDPESTMAEIFSYGDLWNADVTAIGIDGLFYQTEPTYAYVDILNKMTHVPDDVFDAIVSHIKANSPIGEEPYYNADYATYTWSAQ